MNTKSKPIIRLSKTDKNFSVELEGTDPMGLFILMRPADATNKKYVPY